MAPAVAEAVRAVGIDVALERDAVFVELLLEGERVSDGDDVVRPRRKEEAGRRVGIDKVDGHREPLHALIGSFGGEHGIAEDRGSRFVCCDGRGARGEMPARREADDGDALFVDAPILPHGRGWSPSPVRSPKGARARA